MKKKNKFIFLATLSTACLLSLASCQGAQGPKGDQGDPGINGTDGKDGENGKDGTSLLNGKGAPASSLGSNGDSYIDTESFDFYAKENGAWVKKGSLKGESEIQKGEDGTSIRTGKGVPVDSLGKDGDSYIDLSTFDFYVKENGKWSKEGNIKGDKGNTGASGSAGLPGATAWSNTILPSDDGYVTVDKGSAIKDEYVTFTFVPNESKILTDLEINGDVSFNDEDGTTTLYREAVDTEGKLKLKMVAGGFVVKASFGSEKKTYDLMGSDGKSYTSLKEAVDAGVEKITLGNEYSFSDNITIQEGKSFTLDLNGHNLTATGKITVNGEFKLVNTGDANATVTNNGSSQLIVVGGSGSIAGESRASGNLFNGVSTFSNKGLRTFANENKTNSLSIGSKVTISSSASAPAISIQDSSASLTIESGAKVENKGSDAKASAIEVTAGTVTISGEVSAKQGAAVEVKPASKEEASKTTVSVAQTAKVSGDEKAISVSGGTVNLSGKVESSKGVAVEVSATSDNVESTSVNVKGAEVSGTKAITVSSGSLTVETGTVSGSTNGIEVKGGTVAISGGTVESTSEDTSSAAISVVQQVQKEGEETVKTEVTVSGGSIESNGGSAVSVSKTDSQDQGTDQKVSVKLDGGTYATTNGKDAIKDSTATGDEESTIITKKDDAITLSYKIDVTNATGGTIKASKTTAAKDEKITLTITPEDGKYLTGLNVNESAISQTDTSYLKASGIESNVLTIDVTVPENGLKISATFGDTSTSAIARVYEISNKEDLKKFRDKVNSKSFSIYDNATIKLTSDIDLGGEEWEPITASFYTSKLVFDGNNKTVSNFKVTKNYLTYDTISNAAGFFSDVRGLTIKDLTIDNATITGDHYVGGIVGYAYDLDISGCKVTNSDITARYSSSVKDKVTSYDDADKVGGIVGYLYSNTKDSKVNNCTVSNVSLKGLRDLGGIIGYIGSATGHSNTVTNNKLLGSIKQICDYSHAYNNHNTTKYENFGDIIGRKGDSTTVDETNVVSGATITKEIIGADDTNN